MTATQADADLVARTLAGDADAFGGLVERHKSWVNGLALAYSRDFDQADDLAQEAFVEAYAHLASLREASRFAGWLRQIVVNRCKMWARQRRSHRTLAFDQPIATRPPTLFQLG
jgi:RNA polymerase sigma-70 factor (ECF subfamily)